MKKIKSPAALAGAALFVFLFFFMQDFAEGLRLGLENCAKTVIPSLFPFLVAASLAGSGTLPEKAEKILNPITERLFRLPADTLPVIALAQLGGYLSGAKAAESLCRMGCITKSQAQRLMLFSVNAGIGFSVNALGSVMLGSREAGRVIFASLCISSLIAGFFTRFLPDKKDGSKKIAPKSESLSVITVKSVSSSAAAMLTACAFVIFFSGLLSVICSRVQNENFRLFLACILEVTNGCMCAVGKISLPMLAAVCAFGGICVHLQVFALTESLGMKYGVFLFFRVLHAALAFAVCSAVLYFFPIDEQVFLSFSKNAALWSFSAPASVSLLFLSALLILDLDNKAEIC